MENYATVFIRSVKKRKSKLRKYLGLHIIAVEEIIVDYVFWDKSLLDALRYDARNVRKSYVYFWILSNNITMFLGYTLLKIKEFQCTSLNQSLMDREMSLLFNEDYDEIVDKMKQIAHSRIVFS